MTLWFHPEAEKEFFEAVDFYNEHSPGLGVEFGEMVFYSIDLILSHPMAWPEMGDGIRRCLVNCFPYGILYEEVNERIIVYSIMHLHRHPDSWKERSL